MARLSPPGAARFAQAMPGMLEVTFAGAEVNVAVALAQLGAASSFVSALPVHEVADALVSHLRGLGVDTSGIVRTTEGRLGLFYLEHGAGPRPARVIYDRAGSSVSLLSAGSYDWDALFDGAAWFHLSGITPALSANAAAVAEAAAEAAYARGIPVSLDINFRSRLWQWEPGTPPRTLAARILSRLMPAVRVFIGGTGDIAMLTGEPDTPEAAADSARRLHQRWPRLTHVAMLRRECLSASHHRLRGLLWESSTGQACDAPGAGDPGSHYELHPIVDRPGGGDAFAAGLIFALTRAELRAPQRAIDFATATAALAHTIPGDFALLRRSEVETLLQDGARGSIHR